MIEKSKGVRRTEGLAESVDIVVSSTFICFLVVRDVVDLVLLDEFGGDHPWRILDDLVYPSAMADSLQPRK